MDAPNYCPNCKKSYDLDKLEARHCPKCGTILAQKPDK